MICSKKYDTPRVSPVELFADAHMLVGTTTFGSCPPTETEPTRLPVPPALA
jgi:hypothetical protein